MFSCCFLPLALKYVQGFRLGDKGEMRLQETVGEEAGIFDNAKWHLS